jgi:hypothetical protein
MTVNVGYIKKLARKEKKQKICLSGLEPTISY